MASVWYVGPFDKRDILGRTFDISNGWSLPESVFTGPELAIIDSDPWFLLGQPDGPRTDPAPPITSPVAADPGYLYYSEVKRMYDYFVANGGGGVNVPDNSVTPAKLAVLTGATVPGATLFYRGDGQWILPTNTTYSSLTLAEAQTGTATTTRGVNADLFKQILYWYLTGNAATAPGAFGQQMMAAATQAAARSALGTDQVDNTSDANKPISSATATALAGKLDKITNLTSRVLTIDASGVQTSLPYSSASATANSVALRDANGRVKIADGSAAADAASKGQMDTALALRQLLTEKGAANGYVPLDSNGKIPAAYIPALAINEYLGPVASQAAMLALTGQRGDWVIRTDQNNTEFRLSADDPTVLANWVQINPAGGGGGSGAVSSVAGRTGAVILSAADISDTTADTRSIITAANFAAVKALLALGNVNNTADSAKPVSTAQQNALDLKANAANPAFTGTPTGLAKAHVGLGLVDNTADVDKPVSTPQAAAIALKYSTPTVGEGSNRVLVRNSGNTNTTVVFASSSAASTMMFRDANSRSSIGTPTVPSEIANMQYVDGAIATAQAVGINAQSGTAYTLAATDANKAVECTNAAAITVTIPTDAQATITAGTIIEVTQEGAGQVTVIPFDGSVTVTGAELFKTRKQYSSLILRKRGANNWRITGDFA